MTERSPIPIHITRLLLEINWRPAKRSDSLTTVQERKQQAEHKLSWPKELAVPTGLYSEELPHNFVPEDEAWGASHRYDVERYEIAFHHKYKNHGTRLIALSAEHSNLLAPFQHRTIANQGQFH